MCTTAQISSLQYDYQVCKGGYEGSYEDATEEKFSTDVRFEAKKKGAKVEDKRLCLKECLLEASD